MIVTLNRRSVSLLILTIVFAALIAISDRGYAQQTIMATTSVNTVDNWPVHATIRINGRVVSVRDWQGGIFNGRPHIRDVIISEVPAPRDGKYDFLIVWNEFHTGRSWSAEFSLQRKEVPVSALGGPTLLFFLGRHGSFGLFSKSQEFMDYVDESDPLNSAPLDPTARQLVRLYRGCGIRAPQEDGDFASYLSEANIAPEMTPDPELGRVADKNVPACDEARWKGADNAN